METATYDSEFVDDRPPTKQIMDLRSTLRYLGVHIMTKAYMFGDSYHKPNYISICGQQRHNMM